ELDGAHLAGHRVLLALMCVRDLFLFAFPTRSHTVLPTLSLHDALPISGTPRGGMWCGGRDRRDAGRSVAMTEHAMVIAGGGPTRSEEHTSELQSRGHLVCRLLLEKKKHPSFVTHTSTSPTPSVRHSTLL